MIKSKKSIFFVLIVITLGPLCGYGQKKIYWFSQEKIQSKIDQISGTKEYKHNKIKLLVNGVNSAPQRIKNINEADFIWLKTYEFRDDETGRATASLLLKRAKAGAQIFIQFDVKGTRVTSKERLAIWAGKENPIPEMLQALAKNANGNVHIIPTSIPFTYQDYVMAVIGASLPNDHEKYLITWNSKDKTAPVKIITGGLNIGDEYFFGGVKEPNGHFKIVPKYNTFGFRDTDLEIIGQVDRDIVERYIKTAELQLVNKNIWFEKNIKPSLIENIKFLKKISDQMKERADAAFPSRAGNSSVRFLAVNSKQTDPYSDRKIERVYEFLLNNIPAPNTIELATGFFLPTQKLNRAIINATKRGITFRMLLNSTDAVDDDFRTVANAARCEYRYLMGKTEDARIQIYDWHGSPTMGVSNIHQKVSILGANEDDPFIIGSSNLDTQSLLSNSEFIFLIQDPELKKQVDAMLKNDFQQPKVRLLNEKELRDDPFWKRWHQCIYAKFFKSLM